MKKLIPLLALTLALAFTGCDSDNSNNSHKRHTRRDRDTETTIEEIVETDTPTATPVPATTTASETTTPTPAPMAVTQIHIDDYETGEYFIINFETNTLTVNSEGSLLDDDEMTEISDYMTAYTRTVHNGRDAYWPNTDEYPDMASLFRYQIFGTSAKIYDGALCYPDNWDDMKDFLYGYAHVIDDEPRPVVGDEALVDEYVESLNLPDYNGRFSEDPSPRFDVTGDGVDDIVRTVNYGGIPTMSAIVVYDLENNEGYFMTPESGYFLVLTDDSHRVFWISADSTPNNPINAEITIFIVDGELVYEEI